MTGACSLLAAEISCPVPSSPEPSWNVGSGPANPAKLHCAFRGVEWREVRLDIEPGLKPDLVGDMVDMRAIVTDASFDAVWSSHNIEHLAAHEAPLAFREFTRVLKSDGFALVTCPDVEAIARFIGEHGVEETVYLSAAGPVTPLDMLWGHGASIAAGHGFMAHRTGYTMQRLARLVLESGFGEIRIAKGSFDLWALCLMPDCRIEDLAPWFEASDQHALLETGAEAA